MNEKELVKESKLVLKQYYLGCLAHASYLIADEEAKTAVVVDPQRDIEQYLEDAEQRGLKITHVFLTHFHADFLSGHLELRNRVGAKICLGSRAQAEYDFVPLKDGDRVEFGKVRLEILETPGHTPEGISIVVYDLATDPTTPHAVLTGDALFIGDVGRPDLGADLGIPAEVLAGQLYDSLHTKLLQLPDETLVYPAHGAGSLCGKQLSTETFSTLGVQRQYNYALQPMSREEFIRLITADQMDAPAYFSYAADLNRRERPTLDQSLKKSLKPLALDEVTARRDRGEQLLDVRDPAEFAAAHLAGSVNISLAGQLATWAGILLDQKKPIVVIASPGQEEEAAMRLGRIGFDHVAGYLEGGMIAAAARPELVQITERITATTLAEQLASPTPPTVLDVRTLHERKESHIEDSLHIPLNHLRERISEVPPGRKLVVHCKSGYRSSIAAAVLRQAGLKDVSDLVGGIVAWEKFGLPTAGEKAGKKVARPAS